MPEDSSKNIFCFVMSHLDMEGKLPVEIMPNHVFDKATDGEIGLIKRQLEHFSVLVSQSTRYEIGYAGIPHPQFGNIWKSVPPEQWRYWVIRVNLNQKMFLQEKLYLEVAGCLLREEIEIGFFFIGESWGLSTTHQPFSFFADTSSLFYAHKVDPETFKAVANYVALLKTAQTKRPNHFASSLNFLYVNSLPRFSHFQALACFAVIESLLTHKPKATDPTESLTRQIKTKMQLLSKRFSRPLKHEDYFPKLPEKKLWSTLYELRSRIAHGDNIDFKSNDLASLEGPQHVIFFLKEATKLLIIKALEDPALIDDLKEC